MPRRTAGQGWSYCTGEKGRNRVRAYEHPRTGTLYLEYRDHGKREAVALRHRDREAAKAKADELALALRRGEAPAHEQLLLDTLFDKYLKEVTPSKGLSKQAHDRRTAGHVITYLGPHRRVTSLTHRDLQFYVKERQRNGDQRDGKRLGQPLSARLLAYDVAFIHAVLNWAVGAGWIDRNPVKGFRVDQKRHTPKRPMVTGPEYDRLLAVAELVNPQFRLALILANETGHRIGAIRMLRWGDIEWGREEVRWRGDQDKTGLEHRTPLTPGARMALQEARRAHPTIGTEWIFPAPRKAEGPTSRFLVEKWWGRAEALAKLPPEAGRGWHSLRRKFATELNGTPIKDLCALGGWRDSRTILEHYQRADPATMREALQTRRRLEA